MEQAFALVGIVVAACIAGVVCWFVRRSAVRRVLLREAMWQLQAGLLLGANGRLEPATQYASDALSRALSHGDSACEALAREVLGDIAWNSGHRATALHHWRHAAVILQVRRSAADGVRVSEKIAAALDACGAPGAGRWRQRAALLQSSGRDDEGSARALRTRRAATVSLLASARRDAS
jgi:hypothetical protein